MDVGLRDRVALITGAAGGASPTLARAFAAEGRAVALHHRAAAERSTRAATADAEIRGEGGRAIAVTDDSWSSVVDDLLGATFRTCRAIPDERASEVAKTIPRRRIATPDDLATLVVWLASAANTYVTGETISLHGGDQR